MKKTPTLFKRNPENMSRLLREYHPDCDWVIQGEGVATQKYDGACCAIIDGQFYKRREIKKGKKQPDGFMLADHDKITGKTVGWMPVDTNDPGDQYFIEAYRDAGNLPDGTYELIGPKIQGNPEGKEHHVLVAHAQAETFTDAPVDYDALSTWLADKNIEGLVWHHSDGRMAKIKKSDFGLKRRYKTKDSPQ